jgi:hypothetical protein
MTFIKFSPDTWDRYSYGRVFEFLMDWPELWNYLRSFLSDKCGPCKIISPYTQKEIYKGETSDDDRVLWHWMVDVIDLNRASPREEGAFLFPCAECRNLDLSVDHAIQPTLTLSGLIIVDPPFHLPGNPTSCLGLVDKVRNLVTGEIHHHTESLKLYRSIVRALEKTLIRATMRSRLPNGDVAEGPVWASRKFIEEYQSEHNEFLLDASHGPE